MLEYFLSSLGLQDTQIQIYCALTRLGSSPASTIADQLGRERTSTYKLMKSMVSSGYLTQSMRHGAAVFTVIPLESLKRMRDTQFGQAQYLSDHYDMVSHEYDQMLTKNTNIPHITIHQGVSGLRHVCNDMITMIQQYKLIRVTCIASMTFESMGSEDSEISSIMGQLRSELIENKVSVDGYYASGMTLMEQLNTHIGQLESLPTSNDAVSLRVIADRVIVIVMQSQPQIITIKSRLYADLMLFVAGQLGKS